MLQEPMSKGSEANRLRMLEKEGMDEFTTINITV